MKRTILFTIFLCSTSLIAGTLEQIKERGFIRVGVLEGYPPFSHKVSGDTFAGSNIEIAAEVAQSIFNDKTKVEIVQTSREDRIVNLKNDKVDFLIANYNKSKDREKLVTFGVPYLATQLVAITKKGVVISDISQLQGRKIGVNGGKSGPIKHMKKDFPQVPIIGFTGADSKENALISKLKSGEIDVVIGESRDYWDLLSKNKDLEIAYYMKELAPAQLVVDKGNESLLNFLNDVISEMHKNNQLEAIYARVFTPLFGESFDAKILVPKN